MNRKLQVLILELTHDRKRFTAMCTLLALGILLWARIIILQDVPRTGFAEPETGPESAADAENGDETTSKDAESDRLQELPVTYVDTNATLARDFFQRLTIASEETAGSTQSPPVGSKSGSEQTEDPETARQRERQAVEDAAAELRLESVMGGRKPIAVINGNVLAVGDEIEGFDVEDIKNRSVVLRRGNFRVEIRIR